MGVMTKRIARSGEDRTSAERRQPKTSGGELSRIKNLATLRIRKNLHQAELAELVGTTQQTISRWEKGLSAPRFNELTRLASILEVSLDELTGFSCEKDLGQPAGIEPAVDDSKSLAGYASATCIVDFLSELLPREAEMLVGKVVKRVEAHEYKLVLHFSDRTSLTVEGGRWEGCCLGVSVK